MNIEARQLAKILVDKRLCKGCGICVEFCPKKVLEMGHEMDERGFHAPEAPREEDCSLCGLCELYCPDFAICARRAE
jgi:2-oxoglutarate ferredoxin oxidoreductase subunit delta